MPSTKVLNATKSKKSLQIITKLNVNGVQDLMLSNMFNDISAQFNKLLLKIVIQNIIVF